MVDHVMALEDGLRVMILATPDRGRKGEQEALIEELRAQGFVRLRIDARSTRSTASQARPQQEAQMNRHDRLKV